VRREEGYPARGETRHVRLGFWGNVGMALLVYGPAILGAVGGWAIWGGWLGAVVGLGMAMAAAMILVPLAVAVKSLFGKRSDG